MISKLMSVAVMVLLLAGITSVMPVYSTPAATEEQPPPEPEPSPSEETPTAPEPEPEPEPEAPLTDEEKKAENAEEAVTSQDDPIHPCLLDPSDPVCPKPGPDQDCPEGYAQNEDGQCFLLHPDGCPRGYHSHEDDESGRCIPNSTPCDVNYLLTTGENGRKNCERKDSYCQTHQNDNRCKSDNGSDNDNGNSNNGGNNDHNKKIVIVKKIIKNVDIINKIDNANDDDLDVAQTIVAINYQEGAGINCVFDEDDNGQCETFDVNKDSGKEPLLQIIPFS